MKIKKKIHVSSRSNVIWIFGCWVLVVLVMYYVGAIWSYGRSLKLFDQQKSVWINDSRDFFVSGSCELQAGSETPFSINKHFPDIQQISAVISSGQELGSSARHYSMTQTLSDGVWNLVIQDEVKPGHQALPPQLVELFFSCPTGLVQERRQDVTLLVILSMSMVFGGLLVIIVWSMFMQVSISRK